MAAARVKGSPAWAVVVLAAAAAAAGAGALRAAPPPDEVSSCSGSVWYEVDAAGRWSFPSAAPPEVPDKSRPPAVTQVPWDAVREAARPLSTKLGTGLPLPVLTCPRSFSSCPASLPSPEDNCIRIARRGFCVGVGGVCKGLVVSVIEPKGCCCLEKEGSKLIGKITNVTLVNKASNGACVSLRVTGREPLTCCCGFQAGNATRLAEDADVRERNMCAWPVREASGLGERKDGKQNNGDDSGLNELTEERIKKEKDEGESDGGAGGLGEPTEAQSTEATDGEESDGDDGGLSELTEEHIKQDSILEDIIAAVVFLFIGAVLVLIKSRVFRFTRRKRQQEDKDMESQETLVDETVI